MTRPKLSRPLLPLLLAAAIVPGLAACGDDDGGGDAEREAFVNATTTASTPSTTVAAAPADRETGAKGTCREVDEPAPRADAEVAEPDPARLSGAWTVTVATSCGAFEIELDAKAQPKTTASFASLVRAGFFDGLGFHRIATGFVIQGGDPEGTGSGGPGYQVEEEPPSGASYTRGVVAMAKAGNEPAGTSGSQFFVVTGDDTGLPPDYAIVGKVTKGMETVDRISDIGTDAPQGDGPPSRPVVITKATIKKG
ncbi:MAG: peptidylprolyl isomerase [Solirubrobacteraceae bacterium]|nr:peptidylprolyl isomerase [Solirubrobacteraceae bacterium]